MLRALRAASSAFAALEGRLKRAFDISGAFPVELLNQIRPTVQLFDADSVGFHTYTGRRFAGVLNAAVGAGSAKVRILAQSELVITDHWITNLQAAPSQCSLRFFGPTDADPIPGGASNVTLWLEGIAGAAAAETFGILAATDSATVPGGVPIWFGIMPAQTQLHVHMPIHMLPQSKLLCAQDTIAQAISYTWSGYTL